MIKVLSEVKVYVTTNYAIFKIIPGNRPLKSAHVKRLKESILKHGYLSAPIVTNGKGEIMDGQHRFQALTLDRKSVV